MASGPDHYQEAEALLAMAEEQRIAAAAGDPTAAEFAAADVAGLVGAAQAHATLAQAAATAGHWASRDDQDMPAYAEEWREVIR